MSQIIFEVTESPEGGYEAAALGHGIFTQGEDWEDLKTMVFDAVQLHFEDGARPDVIRLVLTREEVLAG